MSRRGGENIGRAGAALWLAGTLVLGTAAACREKGRPDQNIRMAISHEPEAARQNASEGGQGGAPENASGDTGGNSSTQTVPTQLNVPPEVLKAYSGIQLHWRDATSGNEGTLEVPLQGTAKVPDSDLQVRADVFLPAFTMTAESITSTGVDPSNPAARIAVIQKGQEIFTGWIFTRFPDVHPFQHPRFALRLEGGVARKGS
ncbi:MAG TPA: hypothetical protein VKE50_08945 [Thermoanaerobaculia bacterium]|nr:hypothetical protein [Thermoanaerobaculia bacterium]